MISSSAVSRVCVHLSVAVLVYLMIYVSLFHYSLVDLLSYVMICDATDKPENGNKTISKVDMDDDNGLTMFFKS